MRDCGANRRGRHRGRGRSRRDQAAANRTWVPLRALHPWGWQQNRRIPRCREQDDRRRDRWRNHDGRWRRGVWCRRGGRGIAHEHLRWRRGRQIFPLCNGEPRKWRCRRCGGDHRRGHLLRDGGWRTAHAWGCRCSAGRNGLRALIRSRPDIDGHRDGQRQHPGDEDGGQRAADQEEGLAAFRHVVDCGIDICGHAECIVAVEKIGHEDLVGRGAVRVLRVGKADGGRVVAGRACRRQRSAARQRQVRFFRGDDGHRDEVCHMSPDRGDIDAGANDQQALGL